ncbi:integrase catalytic domain-containing protein [Trichonephila clavipes]|nr:integrase catalytic domain-containing protein [Trichonephila clavipes]
MKTQLEIDRVTSGILTKKYFRKYFQQYRCLMHQTPVPAQRFETLAIDLFGPLPESKDGKRWILIIEDCTTKWVELFALPNATAKECAHTLIEEVLLKEKLPFIRFALNSAKCETTGQTAAFLNFGRELRTPSEVVNDIRVVIQIDNFVPEITPYLKKFAKFSTQIREVVEEQQDSRKFYADKKRKAAPTYQPGEHVFVVSHPLSNAAQGRSAKLMPRRDGPYVILTQRSPSSYEIASLDNPGEPLGVYHISALTPCNNDKVKPLIPFRKRGRPPKVLYRLLVPRRDAVETKGEDVTNGNSYLSRALY